MQEGSTSHLLGDISFPLPPSINTAVFLPNGQAYAGNRSVYDPLANPLFTPLRTLHRLPPLQIHTGLPEVLASESAIFATRLAAAGGAVELHLYEGMWHVFPQYFEGCTEGGETLLLAQVALNRTAHFLRSVSLSGSPPFDLNGAPYTVLHYEYPQGHDTADV